MYDAPPAPAAARTRPSRSRIVGDNPLPGLRRGARWPGANRLPLELRKIPSAYTPEPNSTPTLDVSDTAFPAPSIATRCDVSLPTVAGSAPARAAPGRWRA